VRRQPERSVGERLYVRELRIDQVYRSAVYRNQVYLSAVSKDLAHSTLMPVWIKATAAHLIRTEHRHRVHIRMVYLIQVYLRARVVYLAEVQYRQKVYLREVGIKK
jgi:hypothetical protein